MKGFGISINLNSPESWSIGLTRGKQSLETGHILNFLAVGLLIFEVEFVWNFEDE